ncbi:hypothetical protein KAU43_02635 [candidate division WOR-3 bacterium]|nr:hypothetical protein [candidate division WOR-3 bacterium]
MFNNTIDYIVRERRNKRLSYGDIGRALGYKNIGKISSKIADFEHYGNIDKELFKRIVDIIGIDKEELNKMIKMDREIAEKRFEELCKQPFKMHIVIRFMAAVYGRKELPEGIKTEEEALKYAIKYAKENKRHICLNPSRKKRIWINPEGGACIQDLSPYSEECPYMQIGNKRFLFSVE